MSDLAFAIGFLLSTVAPGVAAARLVLLWRGGALGAGLALAAALGAAWLGAGLFLRLAWGDGPAFTMD